MHLPSTQDKLVAVSDSENEISQNTGEPSPQGITAAQKAIAALVLVLLGGGWLFLHNQPGPIPTENSVEERASIPPNRPVESNISAAEPDTALDTKSDTALDTESDTAPNVKNSTATPQSNESEAQETAPKVIERAEEPIDGTTLPSFDVVTINPEGRAVLAGRAEPGATVRIRVNGETIGTTTADKNGEWVFIPQNSFVEGVQELDLVAETAFGAEV